jgi:hypothetical protein
MVSANPEVLQRIAELVAPLVADADEIGSRLSARDRAVVRAYLERIVVSAERRADALVTDTEAADAMPDDEALHLWA